MTCQHKGRRRGHTGEIEIHQCNNQGKPCVATKAQKEQMPGSIAAVCEGCPLFAPAMLPLAPSTPLVPLARLPKPVIARHDEPGRPKLTIGMATYRDWPGAWATIQGIRTCHAECLGEIEIVVIDNDPAGKPDQPGEDNHSFKVKQLCNRIGATYEHFTAIHGTAAAKSRIFDLAKAPAVLVMDCHVLLPSYTIHRLIGWFDDHTRPDLYQGPCIGDGGIDDIVGTHFRPAWGSLMYGQWAIDDRVWQSESPFEIPMQGCGLFACRKDAWPGFHPLLRGFGPEEWHIHQRIRQRGGRVLCIPWLRWCHRFGNPDGTKPPGLHPDERLRGHLITWLDTGECDNEWLKECREHFAANGVSADRFAKVLDATRKEFGDKKIRGAGDVLAALTEATGIKKVVEAVAGKDCGCGARQQKLNSLVPL